MSFAAEASGACSSDGHTGTATDSGLSLRAALHDIHQPFFVAEGLCVLADGALPSSPSGRAFVPAVRAEALGDPTFCQDHGLRYAYLAGAMANGIGSADIVEAMSRAGMLAFFGAAGLPLRAVEAAVDRLSRRGVRLVEASAYLDLTLPVVRYRVHGIHRDAAGQIVTPNRVIAKVSRVEVASKFMSPPPAALLRVLIAAGHLTTAQAELAAQVPMAQDVTAEADSAGHTDNRPAITLLPTLLALRDRLQAEHRWSQALRVGAAGGIATPAAAAAAFAMGAAYLVTGSVNQACVESGSSDIVRQMLAEAEQADTIMAPAADMFEMGVKVQVLKRGTMFAMRAARLYEIYRSRASLDDIPAAERATLEKTIFRAPLDEIWRQTCLFFQERDPSQIARAEKDAKHKMALVFRWYLGQSSRWANAGEPSRKIDYQVWCGPAMGAFNEWTRGSFLERPEQRRVVTVALNLLYGAAVLLRLNILRSQSVRVPSDLAHVAPLTLADVLSRLTSQRPHA
jgi:trans-AT polyketide synthase/acyltransferase/oxidoreductase domain-containing protein